MMFLDPQKPIATCTEASCDGCPVSESLRCHFHGKDLARFLGIVFPAFLIGGIGVFRHNVWLFGVWIAWILTYFGLVEIRTMCSHCPHYAEPGNSLKCWANYGSPKLWKYRPGPMTFAEKWVFSLGMLMVFGTPVVSLAMSDAWLWWALYLVSIVGAYAVMRAKMCSRCMNFACPLNITELENRQPFFARNPIVDAAWHPKSK